MPLLPDVPKAEIAIVEMTNAFRRDNHLATVAGESMLTKAARDYARFLAASPVFSHEADGRRPADRVKAAGYAACSSAENLAWMLDSRGFETVDLATRMVDGWKGSPPHRKNMLIEHATQTGVAIVKSQTAEKYIGVQLFGRPLAKQYQFEIVNSASRSVNFTLNGKRAELLTSHTLRYTLCDPAEITFEVKAGGLLASAMSQRFATEPGQIFRLSNTVGGAVKVDVEAAPAKSETPPAKGEAVPKKDAAPAKK